MLGSMCHRSPTSDAFPVGPRPCGTGLPPARVSPAPHHPDPRGPELASDRATVQEPGSWMPWLSPLSWQCRCTFCPSTLPRAAAGVCAPGEGFKGRNSSWPASSASMWRAAAVKLGGGGIAGRVQLEALALCAAGFTRKLLWGLGELWWGRLSVLHCSPGHEGGHKNGVSSIPWVGGTQGRLGSPGDRGDDKPCAPEQCLGTRWE